MPARTLLLGAALIGRATIAAAQHDGRENVPLTRLREGPSAFSSYSGLTDSARLVVRDTGTWRELWRRVNRPFIPMPATPVVDFQREMIVVAALGARPTAGHDILIEKAEEDSSGIEVLVRRSEPAPGCPVEAAVTQPVDLARLRADRRTVRFRERQVVVPCGCRDCVPEDTVVRTHLAPALGVHIGSPQKASAALGVVFGESWQRGGKDHSRLVALYAEPGLSAGRASVALLDYGHGNFGSGAGIAATVMRTWNDPWTARENETYAGAEVSLWPIVFVGPRIGLFRTVNGGAKRAWFMSLDVGIGL